MYYNEDLANNMNVSQANRDKLDRTYVILFDILENPYNYVNPVQMIEDFEFKLQQLWGFPQLSSYHSYWYKINGCVCPVYENHDLAGWGPRIIDTNCKWHGES